MANQEWLPFLSNDTLCSQLQLMKQTAERALSNAQQKGARNVIDPFSALFQMELLDIKSQDWPITEQNRQIEKSLQNQIGTFHQQVLGHMAGWKDLATGSVLDLVSTDKRIVAEIKNKFNTLNASGHSGLYDKMHGQIRKKGQEYFGYTAYYVEIIPKKPERYDQPCTPSDNTTGQRKQADEHIRRIDGASFYALATGYPDALKQLFYAIPKAFSAIGMRNANRPATEQMLAGYFVAAFGDQTLG